MIESEWRSPARPTSPLSVPRSNTVVECERSRPPCFVSASFAFGSRRLSASDTPLENDSQLVTPQTTRSKMITPSARATLRPQRGRLGAAAPGPRYSTRLGTLPPSPPPLEGGVARDVRGGRSAKDGTFPLTRPPR